MLSSAALYGTGITRYGVVSTGQIVFSDEVRRICETNTCRLYNTSWACPPAVGTVEQCRQRCLSYQNALVFCAVYPLQDSFDYEGMVRGHDEFKELCDRLYPLVRAGFARFLMLSNEGCGRCRACTWPDAPCRLPEKLFPSLEGYGIQVKLLADSAGVPYCGGADTVTYFGMVLFDERPQNR